MIVGAHRDLTFKAVPTVGDGGKYVEQPPDVRVAMADATREESRRAAARLRIAPVSKGVCGEAPVDVEALCDTLQAAGFRQGRRFVRRAHDHQRKHTCITQ